MIDNERRLTRRDFLLLLFTSSAALGLESSKPFKRWRPPTIDEGQELENSPVAWSPDGQKLAFSQEREEGGTDIWVTQLENNETRRITDGNGNSRDPQWTQDSEQIIFVSDRSGNDDLWIVNSDGSNLRPLMQSEGNDNSPSIAPGN